MALDYALFLGCVIPTREFGLEVSAKKVLEAFDVKFHEMIGAGCCGTAGPIAAVDFLTMAAIAARNICIAEEMGMDIITFCTGCAGTLGKYNKLLKEDEHLREQVNEILKDINKEFKGKIEVKHSLDVLVNDIGLDKIKNSIKKKFNGLNVAAHIGCHAVRPSDIRKFDSPERPILFDQLIELTGAKSINFLGKNLCCGAGLIGVADDYSLALVREKLIKVKAAGADCMCTICAACHLQYEMSQLSLKTKFKEDYNIPVLHYYQLLGLSMGVKPEEIALQTVKIKADNVLAKLK
ncbi:MAG: CoB--CoM heterodisulfide reductase iron-sulfur subunit B family protein [Euryarchaeota archaeon]|nr:CoB--CoM heterodisulfide reductase iron-sulfur subunit B family protein [Euryarchaeota archaeon]